MRIKIWRDVDFVDTEIPDDMLRPMVERLLTQRDWDRNLDRLFPLVRNTKIEIADYLLVQAQREATEAAATLAVAEDAPSAGEVWDQTPRRKAGKAAKHSP